MPPTIPEQDHPPTAQPQAGVGASRASGAASSAKEPQDRPGAVARLEAWISRVSARSNFWRRIFSSFFLPIAFRSGIRFKKIDDRTFTAVLPFRRFNRNWYNAMAGAALLANSEIAGGMYVFGACGDKYTVVCRELRYKFLRPCFGPAIYRITPLADLDALVKTGKEFNIAIQMDICQQIFRKPGGKERRVGRSYAEFHATPKPHHRAKRAKRRPGYFHRLAKSARKAQSRGKGVAEPTKQA